MLMILLIIPVLIGLFGLIFGKGKINWKEFLAQEAVVIAIVCAGYFIALHNKTSDTEIWNGVIAKKFKKNESCCHSYPCNCRQSCSGSGQNESCTTICDTCYEHSHDIGYYAITSNDETAYSNKCNSPHSWAPARWESIRLNEPTAIEHSYTNYIKGNPDTIIKRRGMADRFANKMPTYPRVYDYYRVNHVVPVGVNIQNIAELNSKLAQVNAKLGASKKVNVLLLVTNEADQMYLEGLREHWIGGKKNDIVIVVGAPNYPEISWAGVLSWTKNEEIKINIRNRLLDLHTFDGNMVADIVEEEVQNGFVHRSWSDFDYLKSTIKPSAGILWLLFILGIAASIALEVYFWKHDPFNSSYKRFTFRNFR